MEALILLKQFVKIGTVSVIGYVISKSSVDSNAYFKYKHILNTIHIDVF